MRYLKGAEYEEAKRFLIIAAELAKKACCLRRKGGSVIVKDGEIIGQWWNSLPLDKKPEVCIKDSLPSDFKSDKTCCIHAEQRAIFDALKHHGDKIEGSRIYYVSLWEKDIPKLSGKPYCTMCSKLSLEAWIKEFVLNHAEWICVYETDEYNRLSFEFRS